MTQVAASTCKVMGMKFLRDNQIGNAMTWGLRSQDSAFTTFLANRLLNLYFEEGTFTSGDLLDHLGASMVVSERLTFLAKYREFHGLAAAGDFAKAAELLHSLLWSRMSPKYFWVTLLIDTLPFLAENVAENMMEGKGVYFNSEQTYELMHCLHELTQGDEDKSLPRKQRVILEEHEAILRRKLAHNLGVALMQEGDCASSKASDQSSGSKVLRGILG